MNISKATDMTRPHVIFPESTYDLMLNEKEVQ